MNFNQYEQKTALWKCLRISNLSNGLKRRLFGVTFLLYFLAVFYLTMHLKRITGLYWQQVTISIKTIDCRLNWHSRSSNIEFWFLMYIFQFTSNIFEILHCQGNIHCTFNKSRNKEHYYFYVNEGVIK